MRQLTYTFAPAAALSKVGAWLLPWLAVLLVASGLAYAADLGLTRLWPVAPTPVPAAKRNESTRPENLVLIDVRGGDEIIQLLRCLARPGFFTTDTVVMTPQELDAVAAAACERLEVGT